MSQKLKQLFRLVIALHPAKLAAVGETGRPA